MYEVTAFSPISVPLTVAATPSDVSLTDTSPESLFVWLQPTAAKQHAAESAAAQAIFKKFIFFIKPYLLLWARVNGTRPKLSPCRIRFCPLCTGQYFPTGEKRV